MHFIQTQKNPHTMKHSRTILLISSLTLALSIGLFALPTAHASELLPSFINTAAAQDKPQEPLTIDQRKDILKEIISASQDEIKSLTDALGKLELTEDWSLAREQFISQLATSSERYKALEKKLAQKDVTLEEVKAIAKDLKDWRESAYGPELKTAGNMILLYQTEDVRRIVQARNEKIDNDIKKLDRQKLVNTETLKKYLAQADKSIKNAATLNAKAKDLYFKETVAPLQPKAKEEVQKEESKASESTSIESTNSKEVKDTQDEIRELSKEALKELKAAYELFFKMNDRIRK